MEVRANYLIIGIFTLGLFFAAFLFTLWIAKQDKGVPMAHYDIYMKESVTGLSVNNDVLFSGVRVGSVAHIKISEQEPGAVVVRVSIFSDTPVREDSEASLELRGVTGVSTVMISGGTARSPLMHIPDGEVGIIQYKPSPLASMMQSVPETLSSMNELLFRMGLFFSDENLQSLNTTLSSLAEISSKMAERADNLESLLVNANKASEQLAAFSDKMNRMATGMEPGLRKFSNEGLSDMRMLMLESRTLVQSLTRVSKQLENDPRRFFFGEPVKEYKN